MQERPGNESAYITRPSSSLHFIKRLTLPASLANSSQQSWTLTNDCDTETLRNDLTGVKNGYRVPVVVSKHISFEVSCDYINIR